MIFPRKNSNAMSDEDSGPDKDTREETEPDEENSDKEEMEGAKKIRFRKKAEWRQVAMWSKERKSEEDIQALLIQVAKDKLQPWIPEYLEDYRPLDTDLYAWKRKEVYQKAKVMSVAEFRCSLYSSCGCPTMLRVCFCQN